MLTATASLTFSVPPITEDSPKSGEFIVIPVIVCVPLTVMLPRAPPRTAVPPFQVVRLTPLDQLAVVLSHVPVPPLAGSTVRPGDHWS